MEKYAACPKLYDTCNREGYKFELFNVQCANHSYYILYYIMQLKYRNRDPNPAISNVHLREDIQDITYNLIGCTISHVMYIITPFIRFFKDP